MGVGSPRQWGGGNGGPNRSQGGRGKAGHEGVAVSIMESNCLFANSNELFFYVRLHDNAALTTPMATLLHIDKTIQFTLQLIILVKSHLSLFRLLTGLYSFHLPRQCLSVFIGDCHLREVSLKQA